MTIRPGQQVTCRHSVPAYYSNYGTNKGRTIEFRSGMIGTVASIAPKVTMPKRGTQPPGVDWREEFAVVDFVDDQGQQQRVALHFCNVVVV